MTTKNEAYTAARIASEGILDDARRAADQLSVDVIEDAEVRFRARQLGVAAKNVAYALAGDARSAAYATAEQRHRDRRAAVQRHFGVQIDARGDPDADHAVAFVENVADPEGLFAPVAVEALIGQVVETAYNGIRRQIRIDALGRVVSHGDKQETGDGWSNRGTFTGGAEAFMAAKRAAVMPEDEPGSSAPPVPPPVVTQAEPEPQPAPEGLLADIAAALARTGARTP
jgi:hypothetical protein